jgi:hypothetical protein
MRRLLAMSLLVVACGSSSKKPAETATSETDAGSSGGGERQSTSLVVEGEAVAKDDAPDAETAEQIYARVQADLVACYEQGKKSTPKMLSGRATLDVSVDSAGKPACVVVGDDTGLTQDVEDCMSARMSRETFKSNGATWATELPILVKDGKVSLGPPATAAPALETVETHGLPDSAHDVVEALLPQLHECTKGGDGKAGLRVIHVGARVGKDGRVQCALASSAAPMPSKVRTCAASVLAGAKFPPPKGAVGLVSVPVKVLARSK